MTEAADRRVGTYSKGMLQRIGLAQSLVHDPQLVILDEPTAGVDPLGSAAIAEIVRELKRRGKTVLLSSHLLAQIEGLRPLVILPGKLLREVGSKIWSKEMPMLDGDSVLRAVGS